MRMPVPQICRATSSEFKGQVNFAYLISLCAGGPKKSVSRARNNLHPGDGGCPQAGLASKARSEENTKNISNNSKTREGSMIYQKDHNLRFCLPAFAHYANIET